MAFTGCRIIQQRIISNVDTGSIVIYNGISFSGGWHMWRRDVSHWITICLSGLIVALCVYFIRLANLAADSSRMWVFVAFGVFFSIPLFVSFFHIVSEKSLRFHKIYGGSNEEGKPQKTPFVPHWFVVAGMLVIGLSVFVAILRSILSSFAK